MVFLLGGQSNMSGRGSRSSLPSELRNPQTDVRIWYDGDTGGAGPLPLNTWVDLAPGTGVDLGPEVTFGRRMAEQFPEYKIALVKHSVGATSLYSDWNATSLGPRYVDFLNTADNALDALVAQGHTYRIGGMLWYQGEHDCHYVERAQTYAQNLTNFIADVRTRFLEPQMPFLIARIGPSSRPYVNEVRAAQVQVAEADPWVEWINVDPAAVNPNDTIHLSTAGYMDVGEWFADAFIPHPNTGGASNDPKLSSGVVTAVGSSWHTVTLTKNYSNPVVVCSVQYTASQKPVVARVRNASGSTFELRVQNPSNSTVSGYTVHYVVVEAGRYNSPKMEAGRITSTSTDRSGSTGGQQVWLRGNYTRPVVVGQVMTANDPDWSAFWARGSGGRTDAPNQRLYIGKHVGQDTDTDRANEMLGYIVLEAGNGSASSVPFYANVSGDTVNGVANHPPDELPLSGLNTAKVALVSPAGLDGMDLGWPILYGGTAVSPTTLKVSFDEDQIGDGERLHTTESVAYAVFASGASSEAPAPGGGGTNPDPDPTNPQTLTFEAETWFQQAEGTGAAAGYGWVGTTNPTGYSGSEAVTTTDQAYVSTGDTTAGPRLDYNVNFPAAGTYYVWVRAYAIDDGSNSIHAGLRDNGPATYGRFGIEFGSGRYNWSNTVIAGQRVTINVPAAGARVFSLWMRESAIRVDKIVLTQDSGLVPSDTGGGTTPPPGGTPSGTTMRFQAESYAAATPGTGAVATHNWTLNTDVAGFNGSGFMKAGPNSGKSASDTTIGPRLDYLLNFPAAGTYYVHVRTYAASVSDDSLHVGLLSQGPATFSGGLYPTTRGTWAWAKKGPSGNVAINVTSAGTQTFSVWMREDGMLIDEIVVTTNSSFTP